MSCSINQIRLLYLSKINDFAALFFNSLGLLKDRSVIGSF